MKMCTFLDESSNISTKNDIFQIKEIYLQEYK